jgi:hypothetical protein
MNVHRPFPWTLVALDCLNILWLQPVVSFYFLKFRRDNCQPLPLSYILKRTAFWSDASVGRVLFNLVVCFWGAFLGTLSAPRPLRHSTQRRFGLKGLYYILLKYWFWGADRHDSKLPLALVVSGALAVTRNLSMTFASSALVSGR